MRAVRNPKINALITIKKVEVTKDLHHAKVYVSLIGSAAEKEQTLQALKSAAGFISVQAAKKVVMRYFPALAFYLDDTLEDELRIHALLEQIRQEKTSRENVRENE